ncbi:MAG: stage 0 sporulation family protein [Actinomycetia bacterium]|nr:stage 0 sporulation family protein [Actinomycetes bacterium]
MKPCIGIIFRENGRIHYYDCNSICVEVGDKVICHVDDSIEIGEVASPPQDIDEEGFPEPLTKVIRKATHYDLSVDEINKNKEAEGNKKFEQLASKYKLPMKLVDVHVMFDKSKMIFYFTSEKRVDFRDMVKELASTFKMRIELRQIGVRDEAKIIGGLGPCGRKLCCKSFLSDFDSISIKMAKDQNLPLNPLKISGICGRLMCCLKYEYEDYEKFMDNAPERGTRVMVEQKEGYICGYEPLKDSVIVEMDNNNRKTVPLDQITIIGKAPYSGDRTED